MTVAKGDSVVVVVAGISEIVLEAVAVGISSGSGGRDMFGLDSYLISLSGAVVFSTVGLIDCSFNLRTMVFFTLTVIVVFTSVVGTIGVACGMYSLAETVIVERRKIPSAALSFISFNKF